MNFEFFDIHSHLYFSDYDTDREEEIRKMKEKGIGTITIGTGVEDSEKAIELAEKHENMFACVGQHPGDMTQDSVYDIRLEALAHHPRVVAIGECGLDYFRMDPGDTQLKAIQKDIFEKHIDLALKVKKPVMLHIRSSKGTMDAYHDALDILETRKAQSPELRGNAHFFAGNMEILKRFLAIGFTVSFTGVITFTHDYDEFVKATPLDMMMSETDAPFVAPVPFRGTRNSPVYVDEVVKRIAEIRGEPLQEVQKALISNVSRHFGI